MRTRGSVYHFGKKRKAKRIALINLLFETAKRHTTNVPRIRNHYQILRKEEEGGKKKQPKVAFTLGNFWQEVDTATSALLAIVLEGATASTSPSSLSILKDAESATRLLLMVLS
jgi:hypothetical protein